MYEIPKDSLGYQIFMDKYAYPGEKSWKDCARRVAKHAAGAEADENKKPGRRSSTKSSEKVTSFLVVVSFMDLDAPTKTFSTAMSLTLRIALKASARRSQICTRSLVVVVE